jgi:sulfoquinovosidase
VPVVISEQGVGRGLQPLTFALNFFLHGVGADWHTTYVAKPLYLTSRRRALGMEGPKVALFDLRHPRVVTAEYWSAKRLAGTVYRGETPLELIEALTTDTGRMTQPLPAWTQRGVVVGLEGGSDEVEPITEALLQAGVPLVGVWLQDWVGTRQDWDGTRLIWNWEVNEGYYPRWDGYRKRLAGQGVRLLTYINPYLVDVAAPHKLFPHTRNLFAEAVANGYLIKNASGAPLLAMSGSIEFGTIDATNPRTRAWLKAVIAEQMVGRAGSSGWMADFGEYVPFGAHLHAGRGNVQHNVFPDHWASLQREAVAEAGGKAEEDVVVFVRSGYVKTPGLAQLYWVGDQLVTWDGHDGIKTAVLGMLSGGLVGHSLSSSDVGGYTMIDHKAFKFFRSKELLLRWVELGAFLGVFYRTHLGSFMHTPSAQVWDDAESMAHLARFGKAFAALAPYRAQLMAQAAAKGHPVVRALFLHYPDDAVAYTLTQQFLLGPDLLVAPVLDPGRTTTKVYLPREAEGWRHVWSQELYAGKGEGKGEGEGEGEGEWVTVPSPMGAPPVFYRVGSEFAALFDGLRVEAAVAA